MKAESNVALILAAAIVLAGCTTSVPVDPNKVGGSVTLWYLEDPDEAFMPAIKAKFEAKYPGTTVELTELPEDGFVTKIDTALLAQQPPDVSFVYESRWIKAGDVMPLTDAVDKYGIDTDAMNQTALNECKYEDELYCLGSLTGSVMLIYNKDLFDQAGIAYPSTDTPWTIDQYADAARKLHDTLGIYGETSFPPFAWEDRRTHFSEDGRHITGYADDASTIHLYDVLAKLAQAGVSPVENEGESVIASDVLAAGDVAMAITDTEYAAAAMAQAGNRWGVAPPPVEKAGDPSFVFVGTDKYGAFSDSKNPATAQALVAFIATEGNQLRVDLSDKPPLDSRLLPEWAGDDEGRQEVITVLSHGSLPSVFVPGIFEVTAPLEDYFAQMQAGDADPSDAIKEQTPIMQDKLDREWQTWDDIQ